MDFMASRSGVVVEAWNDATEGPRVFGISDIWVETLQPAFNAFCGLKELTHLKGWAFITMLMNNDRHTKLPIRRLASNTLA